MMTRTASLAICTALSILSAPTWAQESTENASEAETESTAEENPTPDIELGTPVDPDTGRRNGELYIREEVGDWSIRCATVVDGDDPCVMYQLLSDETDNDVAEIALRPLSGGEAAAAGNIVAPLETFLPAQLTLSVDGGGAVRYPYTFCTERPFSPFLSTGCVSQVGMTNALVDAFKRGNVATVTVRAAAARDQDISLSLSLTGFTAAFDSLAAGGQ